MSNKSDFDDHFFRLGFNDSTGQIRFYSEQEGNIRLAWVTDEDYSDGEWHHLAATRDGDKGKVYVDGVLIKEDTAMDGDLGGEITGWYLAQDGNTNGYFVGVMDEVRIYDRALTDQEVQQNFESAGMAVVEGSGKLSATWGMIKEDGL
jgi:concanavalin A-like lectin/glucanase superfamily protein